MPDYVVELLPPVWNDMKTVREKLLEAAHKIEEWSETHEWCHVCGTLTRAAEMQTQAIAALDKALKLMGVE
jgi:NADH pyrophosphatase NudC (nudix superfamily)